MGSGCSECAKELGGFISEVYFKKYPDRKNIKALLYFIEFKTEEDNFVKIGITTQTIAKRFPRYKYIVLSYWDKTLYECYQLEKKIKRNFRDKKYIPVYFKNGASECFKGLTVEEVRKVVEEWDKR